MSLIVDPDYIIHSLRLAYLKRIDDHQGPRVLTFPYVAAGDKPGGNRTEGNEDDPIASNSSFFGRASNAKAQITPYGPDTHVAMAGLTDVKQHPELSTIYSPVPTVGELGPFGGFDAKSTRTPSSSSPNSTHKDSKSHTSGLGYTQTIYGPGRSGALGMRVSGRRASKRVSIGGTSSIAPPASNEEAKAREAESSDTGATGTDPSSLSPIPPAAVTALSGENSSSQPSPDDLSDSRATENAMTLTDPVAFPKKLLEDEAPLTKLVNLTPEGNAVGVDGLQKQQTLVENPIASSALEMPSAARQESNYAESSTESNTALSSLGSAGSLQGGSLELPSINAAITGDTPSPHSPGNKAADPAITARSSPTHARLGMDPAFRPPKMVISGAEDSDAASDPDTPIDRDRKATKAAVKKRSRSRVSNLQSRSDYFASIRASRNEVERRHVNRPQTSALSALLQKQDSGPENPFAAFYAGIAGRSSTAPSMTVEIYFPWADARQPAPSSPPASGALSVNPKTKSMKLNIRKDATMEEVIGYGLYCYVEERWKPELNPADGFTSDEERERKTTTIGWTLMIVEDGEVDDDFPAIDQSLLLGKFGGDEFAICEASPNQVKQHREAYGNLARRASRVAAASRSSAKGGAGTAEKANGTAGAASNANNGGGGAAVLANPGLAARLGVPGAGTHVPGSLISVQGTPIFASGALSKSALGSSSSQSIFLRVLVTPNPEVRYKTTLQVPSDMYLADVLEMICRKRHLSNVDEWALIVPDKSIVVPLDRTVESLQGNHDLALVRRSSLGASGGAGALRGSSTNPNASIFKRYSATSDPSASVSQPKYNKALDIASAYKSYTVYRKSPMFGGRHNERSLTLDGDWLHIMPTDMKTFGKAASFHISSVVACKLSSKLVNGFKLVVWRESPRDTKRYDFEADSPRIAAEIVREINLLRTQNS